MEIEIWDLAFALIQPEMVFGCNLQHMAPFGILTIAFCMVFQGATLIFSGPGARFWARGQILAPGPGPGPKIGAWAPNLESKLGPGPFGPPLGPRGPLGPPGPLGQRAPGPFGPRGPKGFPWGLHSETPGVIGGGLLFRPWAGHGGGLLFTAGGYGAAFIRARPFMGPGP